MSAIPPTARTAPPAGGPRRQWYRIENAVDSERTVVRIYDAIGGWFGVWASELVKELDAITAPVIELRVNSPGGDVFEGLAIMNSLRAHPARVIAYVDGMAASAASYIVVGGADEVVMGLGTELMIHNPSAMTWGDSDLHRDSADRLDSTRDNLATVYQGKAGGDLKQWRDAMSAETWYSAAEAVAAGLADRLDETVEPEPVSNQFNLTVFNYAGRAHAPAPKTPAASASGQTENSQEESMSFTNDLRQRLGIADENADEATILAALDEALTERTEPPTNTTAPLPEGTVAIDAAQLQELQAAAREGRDARAQQQREHRERVVNDAVRDGRIAPARREAWLNQLEADPGAEQVLTNLATGLVPVDEQGHDTGGSDPAGFDDAEYQAFAKQLGISPKGA